ncbi:MAG: hypothetical protein WBO08_00635 [Mycobacterium sp.]
MTVTPADLTGTERAVLLVLMAASRPVPNPELIALGPKLEKAGRDKLNQLGLIESDRTGGRFVHELTDRGWRLCRDLLTAEPPPRSTGPAKTLHTFLAAFDGYLRRADLSLAEVFSAPAEAPPSIEDRIRASYAALTARPGAWLALARLRENLADLARDDLDTALSELYRAATVSLIPEENQKVLTAADHAAALEVGNQAKHLISIEG